MAMFLSLGGTSLTSWSPMKILPSETSSRPAIIRRVVVLPQPDGPTMHNEFLVLDLQIDALDRLNIVEKLGNVLQCYFGQLLHLLAQVRQLDRRHGGREPFIARLGARPLQSLLQIIGRQAPRKSPARPLSRETLAIPLATSEATYSKCGVPPRMTAPRQMTAS